MELTERQAVEKSIELWTWLAETGKNKNDWPKWECMGGQYPDVMSHCFLCEYNDRNGGDYPENCFFCPYYAEYGSCKEGKSPFSKWCVVETTAARRKYARRFLNQLEALLEDMEETEDESPITELAEWCEKLISETCDSECPHCNRPLNLPSDEDIENWLKGEK